MTPDGYRPPKRVLDAIQNFPTPRTITDIRSWFGLINQVSYAFSQTGTMAPFRDLLSKKFGKFYWDDSLNTIFEDSKIKIIDMIKHGVRAFEINRPTCLSTDWSKTGLGYTLFKKHCNCAKPWTPICGKGH